MSEEKKVGLSRREFLKDAGLVVGGATLGSMTFLAGCDACTPPVEEKVKLKCPTCAVEFDEFAKLEAHVKLVHPNAADESIVAFGVNGQKYAFSAGDMELLSHTLREKMGLFGLKVACSMGQCGACTVLVDDLAVYSCLTLTSELGGKEVTTVEGLVNKSTGELGETQKRFYDQDAFQCGCCTPGFIMAAEGLRRANPSPDYMQARTAISGHICVCGNVKKVVDAILGRSSL